MHQLMISDLPYCIHDINIAGRQILLNRNYQPIGSAGPSSEPRPSYESYPDSHLKLSRDQIAQVVAPGATSCLFDDPTAPWAGKRNGSAYLRRLRALVALL